MYLLPRRGGGRFEEEDILLMDLRQILKKRVKMIKERINGRLSKNSRKLRHGERVGKTL